MIEAHKETIEKTISIFKSYSNGECRTTGLINLIKSQYNKIALDEYETNKLIKE